MGNENKYHVFCGLVDTYKFTADYMSETNVMREHPINDTEFTAGSIKSAMKKAMDFAKTEPVIESRFAHESPQWTRIYKILNTKGENREAMTRLFKRDVRNTGKVAYIHLTWCLQL